MSDLMEIVKSALFQVGGWIEILLNTMSLLVIVFGVFVSIVKSPGDRLARTGIHPRHTYFRRMFGGWLIVALEFQLAADIVATIVTPSYEELIKLGAIAVIRTFLNYFLNKELNETEESSQKKNE
jgi:uncharacterized membrane protein